MIRRIIPTATLLIASNFSGAAQPPARDGRAGEAVVGIDATIQLAIDTVNRFYDVPTQTTSPDDEQQPEIGGNKEEEATKPTNGSHPHPTLEQAGESSAAATEQSTTSAVVEDGKEAAAKEEEEEDKNLTYDGSDLIEWINANGGFIHPNARIGLDPTGQYRGVFVKNTETEGGTGEGIEDGDIIARIPWDLIVKPKEYAPEIYWSCDALRELYDQFKLGDESKYAPYINYLKNQPRGRIPSEWTDAGKKLLKTILDHPEDDIDESGLPPRYHLKTFEDTWMGECGGEDTELARAAYFQFTSRDEDTLMVPFYDMHNHSNDPKKLNTISSKPKGPGKPFILRTIRDIKPGEQIFISYNRCNRCWFDESYEDCVSYSHYGTSQLFDIFGFVEDLPQMWNFRMKITNERTGKEEWDTLSFCLEESASTGFGDDEERSNAGSSLLVTFGDNHTPDEKAEMPMEANIKYMGEQLVRMKELETLMKSDMKLMESMPRYEWDMAWRYHEALMTAMSSSILASDYVAGVMDEGKDSEDGSSDDSGDDSSDEEDDSEDEGEGGWDEL